MKGIGATAYSVEWAVSNAEISDYMTKEKVNKMLKESRGDYKKGTMEGLRNASQKLYEIMLNYGEWRYGNRYTKLEHFTEDFYTNKKKIPISIAEREQLVSDIWRQHEFAYHGAEEGYTERELRRNYENAYSHLRFLIKNSM